MREAVGFTMRADSAVGRIIGALARTPSEDEQDQILGFSRDGKVGPFISALAREEIADFSYPSMSEPIVALIEARAAARIFTMRAITDFRPIWHAFTRLDKSTGEVATQQLKAAILQIPPIEAGSSATQESLLSLKGRDLQELTFGLTALSMGFRYEVRQLKKMTRGSDRSIYPYFIADEIISKLDEGTRYASSIRQILVAIFFRRGFMPIVSSGDALAERLYKGIHGFGRTVRALFGFATSSVDASGADLSSLKRRERFELSGVVWNGSTTWPRDLADQVRAWSSEIGEDTFMIVEGNSDRNPSVFALV